MEQLEKDKSDKFTEYQSDSLFLLIGTNPLPNYVVCQLLAKPDCHVYLVHTDETGKIANQLVDVMELKRWTKIRVNESDANDIFTNIYIHAEGKNGLGLNYTGGTKSMAVHSYRAVHDADPDAIFSYLDARRLELTIDKEGASSIRLPAGLSIKPSMEKLLTLHNRTPHKLNKDPFHPEVCRELVTIPRTEFRKWCDDNLRSGHGTGIKTKQDPKTELPPFENLSKYWNGCKTIGELAAQWSKEIGSLARWFDGKWLEHYTLWAVQQVAQECEVRDAVWNLEPEKGKFDLDVAALRGYQLFAISCTTGSNKGLIKQKLFEAYIRARQLGGDEARVGVVCFAPEDNPSGNPARIKQEIEEEWDAKGKFRVFGAEDLPHMTDRLKEWFNSQ